MRAERVAGSRLGADAWERAEEHAALGTGSSGCRTEGGGEAEINVDAAGGADDGGDGPVACGGGGGEDAAVGPLNRGRGCVAVGGSRERGDADGVEPVEDCGERGVTGWVNGPGLGQEGVERLLDEVAEGVGGGCVVESRAHAGSGPRLRSERKRARKVVEGGVESMEVSGERRPEPRRGPRPAPGAFE